MNVEKENFEFAVKSCSIRQLIKPEHQRVPANTRVKLTDVVITAKVDEGIFVQEEGSSEYGGIFVLAPIGGNMLKPGNRLSLIGIVKGQNLTRWIEPDSIDITYKSEGKNLITPVEISNRKSIEPYSGMLVKIDNSNTAHALRIDTTSGLQGVLDTRLGDLLLTPLVN